jgi:hypothetical protein
MPPPKTIDDLTTNHPVHLSTQPQVALNLTTKSNTEIIKPEEIISMYQEIMDDIKDDRDEVDKAYRNFTEMVFNEGDTNTASKEALVNLLTLKVSTSDKKTRVMELLLRALLKETPKLDVRTHHAEFNIDRRRLLQEVHELSPEMNIRKKEKQK